MQTKHRLGSERRPAARRALSQALGRLALRRRGQDEQLAHELAGRVELFMSRAATKPAGIDIAGVLLDVLKQHNSLARELLPRLLPQIARARLHYALPPLKTAADLFLDKVELFEGSSVEDLVAETLGALVAVATEGGGAVAQRDGRMGDVRLVRALTQSTVAFLKVLCESKRLEVFSIVERLLSIASGDGVEISRVLHSLAVMRVELDLDARACRSVVGAEVFRAALFGTGRLGPWDLLCLEGALTLCTQYAEALLELHSENTIELLSGLLSSLQPKQILQMNSTLTSCWRKLTGILGDVPSELIASLEKWCRQLPLEELEQNLGKGECPEGDAVVAHSLRLALDWFGAGNRGLRCLSDRSLRWLESVRKHNASGLVAKRFSSLGYFNDLLHVTFALNGSEVERVLSAGSADGFCERFMPALCRHLTRKPFLMMEPRFEGRCELLNEVVRHCVKKRDVECGNLLELVDELWPVYARKSSFERKHSLLLDLATLPTKLGPGSNPMRWLDDCIRSDECSPEMKAKLIGVLPAEEPYLEMWRRAAGLLPARPEEARGGLALVFSALLEALAAAGTPLLGCLLPLLAATPATGQELSWYEDAVDACLESLALKGGLEAARDLYGRSAQDLTLRVCGRLLVPLLRRCSASICEEFVAGVAAELVGSLQRAPRAAATHHACHRAVVGYVRALLLLRVAFEKIPRDHIMSPKSALYSQMPEAGDRPFHLVKLVAKSCANLAQRKVVQCPEGATDSLKEACLQFHCENYGCLTAAICCWAPEDERFFGLVFDQEAWERLVDHHKAYELPLKARRWEPWREGAPPLPRSAPPPPRTRTRTRTRTFLHTLSENPLLFDQGLPPEEQEGGGEEPLPEGGLNGHPCAGPLGSAVRLASQRPHSGWLRALAHGLRAGRRNVSWLLAQVACNCRQDLGPSAGVLVPALLDMVARTSEEEGLLNGLHVEVLDAIVYWREEAGRLTDEAATSLGVAVERLIATCVRNAGHRQLVDGLVARLDSLLELYGSVVRVSWNCFREFVEGGNKDSARAYFEMIRCVTRRRVPVPELLGGMLGALEGRGGVERPGQPGQLGRVGQLLGLAAAAEGAQPERLHRLRRLLERQRGDAQQYVELLHGLQSELPAVCDAQIFRSMAVLASRSVGRVRDRMLEILAAHLRWSPSEECGETLECLRLQELAAKGDEGALRLAEAALPVLVEPLKTWLVVRCGELCQGAGKVRKAAVGVLLRAFEGLLRRGASEPQPKRPAGRGSALLRQQWAPPLAALGLALASRAAAPERRRAAAALPPPTAPRERFTEAFIISVHLPMTHQPSECGHDSFLALLEIFFAGVRGSEALQRPLREGGNATLTSETVSMEADSRSQIVSVEDAVPEEAKTVGDVLEAVLQFAERSAEAATALWLQLVSLLWRLGPGFDAGALLAPLLRNAAPAPLLRACSLLADECCAADGFKETVERLMASSRGAEGGELVRLLHEDVLVRTSGMDYFFLG
ncbi:unnamed protein product, partial [Iphiclides podalirius]